MAETPRTSADVLRKHALMPWDGRGAWTCACSRIGVPEGAVVFADREAADQHQADMLAAAGLLATAEHVVMRVHYGDSESHARSFNEGFETAVAQGLADDPTLAADWLTEHDAEVRHAAITEVWDQAQEAIRSIQQQHQDVAAKALRDAAAGIQALHPGEVKASVIWLQARANRIATGETP